RNSWAWQGGGSGNPPTPCSSASITTRRDRVANMATSPFPASPEDVIAAVDINRVAGHRTGEGARQENAGGADLVDGYQTAGRSALRHPRHQRIEIRDAGGRAGGKRARTDGVHADPFGAELDGRSEERR